MKITLVILAFVVVVAPGFFFITLEPKPVWSPNTQLIFLGFTNTVATAPATNAFFRIKSIPKEKTSWRVREISQKEGARWKAWRPLPPNTFAWHARPTGNWTDIFALIAVETTNQPSRIVIELRKNTIEDVPPWWRTVRVCWAKVTRGDMVRAWKGKQPTFFITNEISAAK
jgi:hypothetical protein